MASGYAETLGNKPILALAELPIPSSPTRYFGQGTAKSERANPPRHFYVSCYYGLTFCFPNDTLYTIDKYLKSKMKKLLLSLLAVATLTLVSASGVSAQTIDREACFPKPLSPSNNAYANQNTKLIWTSCPAVNDSYEVWITNRATNQKSMVRQNGTTFSLGTWYYVPGLTYKWYIRACYNVSCTVKSLPSQVQSFIWAPYLID